jgi:hypothetical protein
VLTYDEARGGRTSKLYLKTVYGIYFIPYSIVYKYSITAHTYTHRFDHYLSTLESPVLSPVKVRDFVGAAVRVGITWCNGSAPDKKWLLRACRLGLRFVSIVLVAIGELRRAATIIIRVAQHCEVGVEGKAR